MAARTCVPMIQSVNSIVCLWSPLNSGQSPVFLSVFFCRCFVLCAHALCSCFVPCAPCSCFVLIGFLVTARQAQSTKHEACARSRWPVLQKADAPAHKNRVFLSRTGKHKAQSMSRKQPILTKRCDFEHKVQSTKHKALSMSSKQQQKNWALFRPMLAKLNGLVFLCYLWSVFSVPGTGSIVGAESDSDIVVQAKSN
jgi:hypothetical protein